MGKLKKYCLLNLCASHFHDDYVWITRWHNQGYRTDSWEFSLVSKFALLQRVASIDGLKKLANIIKDCENHPIVL